MLSSRFYSKNCLFHDYVNFEEEVSFVNHCVKSQPEKRESTEIRKDPTPDCLIVNIIQICAAVGSVII